jgi:hypothetical protein
VDLRCVRFDLQTVGRTFLRYRNAKLFDLNAAVAQQAAYSLVMTSKSFSAGRKPGKISDLDASAIDHVREDLEKLLPRIGDKYYSYGDLVGLEHSRNAVDIRVRIRLSRQLPFRLNGRPVIIAGSSPQLPDDPHVTILTVPSAVSSVFTSRDPEWQEGDFFLADCEIHIPSGARKVSEIPILFTVDGLAADGHSLSLR